MDVFFVRAENHALFKQLMTDTSYGRFAPESVRIQALIRLSQIVLGIFTD